MIKTILVNGASGVLGSQIALQTAVSGFNVIVYGRSEGSLDRAKQKMESYIPRYKEESNVGYDEEDVKKAYSDNVTFSTDLEESAKNADLIIEAILEKQEAKEGFFSDLAKIDIPEETIFATNTSSLRPSDFMEATGRPDRFLALHFQNEIWKHNVAEVMGTSKTSDETKEMIIQFAKDIEMRPVVMKIEQPGYVVNTLFIPYLRHSLGLFGRGEASPYDIDRAWMKATKSPHGPFASVDTAGFGTPAAITQSQIDHGMALSNNEKAGMEYVVRFLSDNISLGRNGKVSGEGFYHYADSKPEFLAEDFLADTPDISIEDYGTETGDEEKDEAIKLYTMVANTIIYGGLELFVKDAAEFEDIDLVWKSSFEVDFGPFGLIHKIGTEKVHEVLSKTFETFDNQNNKELYEKVLQALKDNDF